MLVLKVFVKFSWCILLLSCCVQARRLVSGCKSAALRTIQEGDVWTPRAPWAPDIAIVLRWAASFYFFNFFQGNLFLDK